MATTVCFVFCLERDDLNSVLNRFPNLRATLEVRARERLLELYRSEERSPSHILSVFSERLTETETLMSKSKSNELQSGESKSFSNPYPSDINQYSAAAATTPQDRIFDSLSVRPPSSLSVQVQEIPSHKNLNNKTPK